MCGGRAHFRGFVKPFQGFCEVGLGASRVWLRVYAANHDRAFAYAVLQSFFVKFQCLHRLLFFEKEKRAQLHPRFNVRVVIGLGCGDEKLCRAVVETFPTGNASKRKEGVAVFFFCGEVKIFFCFFDIRLYFRLAASPVELSQVEHAGFVLLLHAFFKVGDGAADVSFRVIVLSVEASEP